ncbi:50S ribosomal protein L10 [Patescibacteria group bacterium]|nr:50S ribosomal protein L10 [Patescibacteria group bacterium]
MAKSKEQKQEILKTLGDKISRSKSIVFTSFNALGVQDNQNLRAKLREEGGEYYVAKKSLLDLALKDQNIKDLDVKNFEGKLATIFSYDDEVGAVKALDNFRKDNEEKLIFMGGILKNKFLSSEEVSNLAKIPSREELYAKMVGSLNAPVSGFANVLAGNLRKLVYALNAVKEAKS